ncbi:MAG: CPBP family glutamic-type intramembrane protease [Coleofasciculaceae cyanobacterium]
MKWFTIKRLILLVLTIFAIAKISLSLVESWSQPQIQSRLELYQTNLLLHAAEWQADQNTDAKTDDATADLTGARNALIGDEPFKAAQKQYEEARKTAETTQKNLTEKLAALNKPSELSASDKATVANQQQLESSSAQVKQLINELDLRLGLLQIQQQKTEPALKTWTKLASQSEQTTDQNIAEQSLAETAQVLTGLWSTPPRLLPDAEPKIQKNLDSWFRYRALSKLYKLQQRQDVLSSLQTNEQEIAQQAIFKLAIIGGIPGIGGIIGVTLLLFLVAQRLLKGKDSILATNGDLPWETPWNWEVIWQVLIVGFFFIGQFLLPVFFGLLQLDPSGFTVKMKAFYVLSSYLLMAGGGLLVLYLSIKSFLPIPQEWFRFKLFDKWILWGFGGYFVALPLVILVSLINQQIWQGQGGSNPILPLALEGRDNTALLIFFITASVAAPIFEEIMFRGFLLPSLTRYMPVWGAVVASSLLFAIAHLSLSEVLPLATLGMVLGIVYTRSRNLLSSILLHSLWNAGTLFSLFVLGSGSN